MKNGVKNPRSQKHVAEVVDYVRHCGGDDIQVVQNGHLKVGWLYRGKPMRIALPVTANKGAAVKGKQEVRKRYREQGVEVRA